MCAQKTVSEIQSQIDAVNSEAASYIGRIERDLAAAREQRLTEPYQLELETQIQQAKAMYDGVLNRLDGELTMARETDIRAAAEKQEKQTRAAAETKEQIKSELKAAWIEAGGDLEIFEVQFPQLYAQEISKRAVDKMIRGDGRGHATVIRQAF